MEAWNKFLEKQEKILGAQTTSQWLRSLKVVHFDAGNLYLEAESPLHLQWFEEHIRVKVKKELVSSNGRLIKVHLQANEGKASSKKRQKIVPLQLIQDLADPSMTMESYIAPDSCIAFKLLQELPTSSFNPIYLYGQPGIGKTHLLMATVKKYQDLGLRALYVHTETFTEHVVQAIRASNMKEFREAYRHVDLIAIDDVHLFSKRNATQEEFFHTFNALHGMGKQLILTGQTPPGRLVEIEPRLISRFEWGIVLSIEKPGLGELKQIMKQKALRHQFSLSDELLDLLMHHFSSHLPSLHRALDALILRTHTRKNTFDVLNGQTLEILLKDLIEEKERAKLSSDRIIYCVASFYGIRVEDILGKSQSQECTLPRQIAMFLCRSKLKLPYVKIGDVFGRDHSTVMTSVKQIEKKILSQDKEICSVCNALYAKF